MKIVIDEDSEIRDAAHFFVYQKLGVGAGRIQEVYWEVDYKDPTQNLSRDNMKLRIVVQLEPDDA